MVHTFKLLVRTYHYWREISLNDMPSPINPIWFHLMPSYNFTSAWFINTLYCLGRPVHTTPDYTKYLFNNLHQWVSGMNNFYTYFLPQDTNMAFARYSNLAVILTMTTIVLRHVNFVRWESTCRLINVYAVLLCKLWMSNSKCGRSITLSLQMWLHANLFKGTWT
jgi:hypothetical protein